MDQQLVGADIFCQGHVALIFYHIHSLQVHIKDSSTWFKTSQLEALKSQQETETCSPCQLAPADNICSWWTPARNEKLLLFAAEHTSGESVTIISVSVCASWWEEYLAGVTVRGTRLNEWSIVQFLCFLPGLKKTLAPLKQLACVRLRLSGCLKQQVEEPRWQKDESLLCFINWQQKDSRVEIKDFYLHHYFMDYYRYCYMWYNRYGLKIQPPPVSLLFFTLLSVFLFSLYSSASSQALSRAQLSAVTHCHSFISSLHHSFCPSADLGIHLSIHLSAPFSLTSGNDEERRRGEERRSERWGKEKRDLGERLKGI